MRDKLELKAELEKRKTALEDAYNRLEKVNFDLKSELQEDDSGLRERNLAELEVETARDRLNQIIDQANASGWSDHLTESEGQTYDYDRLARGCSVTPFLRSAVSGKPLTGAEAELSQEVFGTSERSDEGGTRIPWRLIAAEERADVPTQVATGQGDRREEMWLGRVFRGSVSGYLGVSMRNVPAGTSQYTVLSAGHTPTMEAAGSDHESTAATLTATSLEPKRLTGRYSIRKEDLAKSALLESGLRDDLRSAVQEAVDSQVIAGSGSGAEVSGILNALGAATDAVSSTVDFAGYIDRFARGVDALYARDLMGVKALVARDVFSRMLASYRSNESDLNVWDWAKRNLGGIQVTNHLPSYPTSGSGANQGNWLLCREPGDMMANHVAAFWNGGVEVVRDPYTDAGKAEIHLTMHLLWNYALLRSGAFQRVRAKVA